MIRVKLIEKSIKAGAEAGSPIVRGNCIFIQDAACTDYDWLVVYDELPRNSGSITNETEVLHCPREHTILVTVEPPSIKLYPKCYTSQFEYVLTTHTPQELPHRNHIYGEGSLKWCAGIPLEEVFDMRDYPKAKDIATVCSTKQQTHTLHKKRYDLTSYLASRLPELDWYGWGVIPLDKKYEAQEAYRYSIAVENYIAPYHWTDKISDPILNLCLTFYAGDPRLEEVLPAESFIRIPLDDHEEAYRIIRNAIDNNEYEKRLPAIREARRIIVEQNNIYNRIASLIEQASPVSTDSTGTVKLKGRHTLRRNPLNALAELVMQIRHKLR